MCRIQLRFLQRETNFGMTREYGAILGVSTERVEVWCRILEPLESFGLCVFFFSPVRPKRPPSTTNPEPGGEMGTGSSP